MKNILNTEENLELFNKNGKKVYSYNRDSDGYSYESTYNKNGNVLTFKNSDEYSYECTYDENNNELTFKTSNGFWREKTYDENNIELTYSDSTGYRRVFTISEYTIIELTRKIRNFKLIK